MDFILGIFTGFGLAFYLGYHLNQKERKRKEVAQKQHLESVKAIWLGFRITPEDLEYLNYSPPRYPLSPAHAKDLNAQIQAAIQREDFEEAARLRDLINKR